MAGRTGERTVAPGRPLRRRRKAVEAPEYALVHILSCGRHPVVLVVEGYVIENVLAAAFPVHPRDAVADNGRSLVSEGRVVYLGVGHGREQKVVNCFRDRWWEKWLAKGWTGSARQPVANRDLWQQLVDLYRQAPGRLQFR